MGLTVFAEEASLFEIGKRSRDSCRPYGQTNINVFLRMPSIDLIAGISIPTVTCGILVFLPFLSSTLLLLWLGCHIPTLHAVNCARTQQEP